MEGINLVEKKIQTKIEIMKGGDVMNKKKPAVKQATACNKASANLKHLRIMSMPKLISPPNSPPKLEGVSQLSKLNHKSNAMEKAGLDGSNSDNKEPRASSRGGEDSELEPKTSSGSSNNSSSSSSRSSSSSSGFVITKAVTKNSVTPAGSQRGRVAYGKNTRGRLSSVDEMALRMLPIIPKKKPSIAELHAQKKLKMAEYGRVIKNGAKLHRTETPCLPANIPPPTTSHDQLKSRCKFITAQTDPVYIAYHDDEWGVPVYDDRLLFELLVLVGAQVELSWPTILRKRDAYRSSFSSFDPEQVAKYSEKRIAAIESDRSIMLHSGKIRGVVENAKRILQVNEEFGSFSKYLWSFVNNKAMVSKYRYSKQVPVKTSKSEWMSKDLVKRGFRFVGPTIMYSFMQASGMVNDHLLCCFRHSEIEDINASSNTTNGSVDWEGDDEVKPEIGKHHISANT